MPDNNNMLGLSDLRLLMDNYQNIVKMNTILLEQQKQVVDLQKNILNKTDEIARTQIQVCNTLNNVASILDTCADKFIKLTNDTLSTYVKINDNITHNFNKVKDKLITVNIDNAKEHSGIKNKIYVAMVGSGAVVVSLITLLIIVYDKYQIIANIEYIVNQILQKIVG